MFGNRARRHDHAPDLVPELSRGKHRSPRKGACFMEFASYLAGERWSDHPECTHPLLASMARLVNDYTSDEGRQRLAALIPRVVGLTGDDPRIDAHIALRAATTALPVVAHQRQRVLAVAVLTAERVLADLEDRSPDSLSERSKQALAQAPLAAEWARDFAREVRDTPSARNFRRQAAPVMVSHAVTGIAQACVPDPDGMLHGLLAHAIDDCAALVPHHKPPAPSVDLRAAALERDRVA